MTDYIRERSEAATLQAEKDREVQNERRKAQMRLERKKEEAERRRFQHILEQAENGGEVLDEIKESWLMPPRERYKQGNTTGKIASQELTDERHEDNRAPTEYYSCSSHVGTVWTTSTGTRTQPRATWDGVYTLNYSSGFAGGALVNANYKGVRKGREQEVATGGVGRLEGARRQPLPLWFRR